MAWQSAPGAGARAGLAALGAESESETPSSAKGLGQGHIQVSVDNFKPAGEAVQVDY